MNELLWTAVFIVIFCILLYFGNRWKIKYDIEKDISIDWKDPKPKNYEGNKPNILLEDEIGHFDRNAGNWKLRKGLIGPDALTDKKGIQPIDHSKIREWKGRESVSNLTEQDLEYFKKWIRIIEDSMKDPLLKIETEPVIDLNRAERWKMGPIQTSPERIITKYRSEDEDQKM